MKYIYQIGIISGISLAAELLYVFLPLPVPASVYGLVILFILLLTKIIKIEQIEDTADWLLKIMPVLFIGPSVGLISAAPAIAGQVVPLIIMGVLSTIGVMIVTAVTAQILIRAKEKDKNE